MNAHIHTHIHTHQKTNYVKPKIGLPDVACRAIK